MPEQEKKIDTRVDDRASDMFGALGYDRTKLPDLLVAVYRDFKSTKDRIRPGSLSEEGYAFVVTLANFLGNPALFMPKPEPKSKPDPEKDKG